MKKRYKIFLMLIIIQLIFSIFLNTHVFALYNSLEAFVKDKGVEKLMTNGQIGAKQEEARKKIKDQKQRDTIADAVGLYLRNVNATISDEEKMKMLNDDFINNQGDAYGDEAESDLYYGYMLGEAWVNAKNSIEESKKNDAKGKTVAEQFDEKYKEYKNLKDKDINKLMSYQTALKSLYNKLSKDEQTNKRTQELDEVDTAVLGAQSKVSDERDESDIKEEEEKRKEAESTAIYQYPDKVAGSSAGSLDDMIGDAEKFIKSSNETAISADSLQSFSKTYYNIFLTIGIIVATLVGAILGIKFMIGGAEEKANVKELLIPYIAGCVIIFGAFAIWKLVVTILSNV